MATTENIVDAFDDLGFTLEDSRVIDRLVSRHCNRNFINLNLPQVKTNILAQNNITTIYIVGITV